MKFGVSIAFYIGNEEFEKKVHALVPDKPAQSYFGSERASAWLFSNLDDATTILQIFLDLAKEEGMPVTKFATSQVNRSVRVMMYATEEDFPDEEDLTC